MKKMYSEVRLSDANGETFSVIDNVAGGDGLAFLATRFDITNEGANDVYVSPRAMPTAGAPPTAGIRILPATTVRLDFDTSEVIAGREKKVGWAALFAMCGTALTSNTRVIGYASK